MKNNFLIGIIIVAVIIGGYFIYQNFSATPSATNTQQEKRLQIETSGVKKTDSKFEQQENLDSKFCNIDDECGLLICSGCFSKEFLKTAPPDLPCRRYEGYSCECINNKCTEVK